MATSHEDLREVLRAEVIGWRIFWSPSLQMLRVKGQLLSKASELLLCVYMFNLFVTHIRQIQCV